MRGFVICLLAALCGGCGEAIFEDVGADPHAPELTLLGVAIQPPGDPPPLPNFLPPETIITVRPFDPAGKRIAILVSYRDAGADIETVTLRDLGIGPAGGDGQTIATVSRPYERVGARLAAGQEADGDVGIPAGTAGRAWLVSEDFPVSVQGLHRLEFWAEDLHGSRSAKVPFTINVQLF